MDVTAVRTKIDVCVVTRDGKLPSGLGYVPMANLIVETSRPLGLARHRAIQKVRTEWFACLDDDLSVSPLWWSELEKYRTRGVGAVQGDVLNIGLGKSFDAILRPTRPVGEALTIRESGLRPGERGMTHNVLIRTDLVRDWQPSKPSLEAYEDWEITQHILKKGFRWLVVPTTAQHWISWRKVAKSALWGARWWRQSSAQPTVKEKLYYIYCLVMQAFTYLRLRGFCPFFYQSYFTLFVALGLLLNLRTQN